MPAAVALRAGRRARDGGQLPELLGRRAATAVRAEFNARSELVLDKGKQALRAECRAHDSRCPFDLFEERGSVVE
jgi:hypothetical protein